MKRVSRSLARSAAALASLAFAAAAVAGGSTAEGPRKSSNSFNLLYTATAPSGPNAAPAAGVGVGPSKPIVSNPYNVPLIQNAGSLHSGR